MTFWIIVIFAAGYAFIAVEHYIRINKAAIALITGVLCWTIYILFAPASHERVAEELTSQLGGLAGILFFLMGAMTIVELIDLHNGFEIITKRINQTNKRKLLWIISFITFFLSPILDNLTTTIVMVSLTRKLISSPNERIRFACMIVIAANAGGAWSPIGDVTTTMLWIGGQISAENIVLVLFLPSLVCTVVPLLILTPKLKGRVVRPKPDSNINSRLISERDQYLVFFSGIVVLLLVPVFKAITGLPPYMGILLGLGVLWIITEILHGSNAEDKHDLSVSYALRKIDTPSILFFLGLLISISALEVSGILTIFAEWLIREIKSLPAIAISFGIISSIIDNVPLLAATQGMFSLEQFPRDHYFWTFLAYCTGTGGSILIIGSAAGVAAMGMEKINFFWYLKRIGVLALAGYAAGAALFLLQHALTR